MVSPLGPDDRSIVYPPPTGDLVIPVTNQRIKAPTVITKTGTMTTESAAALAITTVVQPQLVRHTCEMIGVPATIGTVVRRTKIRPTTSGTPSGNIKTATSSGVNKNWFSKTF